MPCYNNHPIIDFYTNMKYYILRLSSALLKKYINLIFFLSVLPSPHPSLLLTWYTFDTVNSSISLEPINTTELLTRIVMILKRYL